MSIAAKYNKGNLFKVNTEGYGYKKLEELYNENGADQEYEMRGIYISHKSEFGDAPVAICDGFFVNLPSYLLDDANEMMRDQETIDAINAGTFGFKIEPYEKEIGKKTKTCYGVRWVDL